MREGLLDQGLLISRPHPAVCPVAAQRGSPEAERESRYDPAGYYCLATAQDGGFHVCNLACLMGLQEIRDVIPVRLAVDSRELPMNRVAHCHLQRAQALVEGFA